MSAKGRKHTLALVVAATLCVLGVLTVFAGAAGRPLATGDAAHELTRNETEIRGFTSAPEERDVYRLARSNHERSSVGAKYSGRGKDQPDDHISLPRSSKDNFKPGFYKHFVPTELRKPVPNNSDWTGNTLDSYVQGPDVDYSTFKHTNNRHASLACTTCHQRTADNSAKPDFPGHSACINCHGNQFFSSSSPMCTICHSDVNTAKAPLKSFPANFKDRFNIRFDHAQHMSSGARPKSGCSACHVSGLNRGVALSIPTGLSAHTQCYGCHTPASKSVGGRDLASCGVCHEQKNYTRTSTNGAAFRASFSHAKHGPRQRLECTACHSLTPGGSQGKQVSSPRTAEHSSTGSGQSCQSCHNGKRTFGGDLAFKDCRRCHSASTFRFPG